MTPRCPLRGCNRFAKVVEVSFKAKRRGRPRRRKAFLQCKAHGRFHMDGTPTRATAAALAAA